MKNEYTAIVKQEPLHFQCVEEAPGTGIIIAVVGTHTAQRPMPTQHNLIAICLAK